MLMIHGWPYVPARPGNTAEILKKVYCLLAEKVKVSGGSREQDCHSAASEIFPCCHCAKDASVAETCPPSAESKTTTTPAVTSSVSACSFHARANSCFAKPRFSRTEVSSAGDVAGCTENILTFLPRKSSHFPGNTATSSRVTRNSSADFALSAGAAAFAESSGNSS